jgi:hypothetical protein
MRLCVYCEAHGLEGQYESETVDCCCACGKELTEGGQALAVSSKKSASKVKPHLYGMKVRDKPGIPSNTVKQIPKSPVVSPARRIVKRAIEPRQEAVEQTDEQSAEQAIRHAEERARRKADAEARREESGRSQLQALRSVRWENDNLKGKIAQLQQQEEEATQKQMGLFTYIEELERVNQLLVKVAPQDLARRVASQKRVAAQQAKAAADSAITEATRAAVAADAHIEGGKSKELRRIARELEVVAEEAMRWEKVAGEAALAAEAEVDIAGLALQTMDQEQSSTPAVVAELAPFRDYTERMAALKGQISSLVAQLASTRAAEEKALLHAQVCIFTVCA